MGIMAHGDDYECYDDDDNDDRDNEALRGLSKVSSPDGQDQ